MRNLLLTILAATSALAASAQCSVNASLSITPGVAPLTCSVSNNTTFTSLPANAGIQSYVQFMPAGGYIYLPANATTTKTFPNCGNYTAKLIVHVIDSNTMPPTLLCSDTVIQNFTVTCAPCYTTITKSIGANGAVTFTANTPAGTSGMTYNWNFGDGTWGTGSPITHTYTTNGSYSVTLGASSTSASCVDSSFTSVNVTNVSNQNKISGYVFADTTQADSFKVWLIQFDSATNNLYAVDSTDAYTMSPMWGSYSFNNKPAGVYRVKAAQIDGPSSGTGYVPTYHTSSLYWNTASLIYHGGGNTPGRNIAMQTGTVTSGPGFIGGNVSMGANKGTSNGIEGMLIILRDANGSLVTATYTDANGNYSFNNIPAAAYSVYPEDGGYSTTPTNVVLNSFKATANGISFERTEKDKSIKPVTTSVKNIVSDKTFEVYPNPANGKVFINLPESANGKADITISNVTGSKVFQTVVDVKNGRSELNISHLQAGHYYITIDNSKNKETQKLVIEK